MDGKRGRDGDDRGEPRAAGEGWGARMMAGLERQAEQVLEAMAAEPAPTDILGIDRKAKAITNLARAVRAIEALRPRAPSRTHADTAEDTMSDDDDDTVDPAEFERARAELDDRLDRLRRTVETKRLEGWPLVQGNTGADAGGEPAWASGPS